MRKYCDIDGFYNYTRNSVEEFGSPDKGGNFWIGKQVNGYPITFLQIIVYESCECPFSSKYRSRL